jgi:hypothetical protein
VKRRPTLVDRMMNEVIDYGGEQITRAEAIRRLYKAAKSTGHPNPRLLMETWLFAYDQRKERGRCATTKR